MPCKIIQNHKWNNEKTLSQKLRLKINLVFLSTIDKFHYDKNNTKIKHHILRGMKKKMKFTIYVMNEWPLPRLTMVATAFYYHSCLVSRVFMRECFVQVLTFLLKLEVCQ